jgi:hypothetical protein
MDPLPIIDSLITKQIQRTPGRTIINGSSFSQLTSEEACGEPGFAVSIRKMALHTMGSCHNVEFVESEFQPQCSPKKTYRDMELGTQSVNMAIPSLRARRASVLYNKVQRVKSHSGFSNRMKTLAEAEESSREKLGHGSNDEGNSLVIVIPIV